MNVITHVKRHPENNEQIVDLYYGIHPIPRVFLDRGKASPYATTSMVVQFGRRTARVFFRNDLDSWSAISDDGIDLMRLLPDVEEANLVESGPRGANI